MVGQTVSLQPMEVHGGADIYLQPMKGTPRRSRWMPEGRCEPVGNLCWSRLLGRSCGPEKRGAGAGLVAGLVTPRGTHTGSSS